MGFMRLLNMQQWLRLKTRLSKPACTNENSAETPLEDGKSYLVGVVQDMPLGVQRKEKSRDKSHPISSKDVLVPLHLHWQKLPRGVISGYKWRRWVSRVKGSNTASSNCLETLRGAQSSQNLNLRIK